MNRPISPRLALLSAALAVVLAACGGGGSPEPAAVQTPQSAQLVAPSAAATAAPPFATQAGAAAMPVAKSPTGRWIVQLADAPASAYEGTVRGLAATRPAQFEKLDPAAPAVVSYMAYLKSRHESALAAVGASGRKLYSYGYVFNGFAAELSDAQAHQLAATKGVLSVVPDEVRQLATSSTPGFLGLAGPDGFWAKFGARGENVVIGLVDTGIWPEADSFGDRLDPGGAPSHSGPLAYAHLPRNWHGSCVASAEQWTAANCNMKLIGARYYNQGFGGDAGVARKFPGVEYLSPRDYVGHGSHTASTSGGNAGAPVSGPLAGYGPISGMAPRARLAVYKVCWSDTAHHGGCSTVDSIAAIEQAIADGVDVINYSISGSQASYRDPVEIAFLEAAKAGVFVAAASGNTGKFGETNHPSPWLTTVAAGTHNREVAGSARMNGVTYPGTASLPGSVTAPIVMASAVAAAGADANKVRLCYSAADNGGVPVLDPAKAAGKIVVCERGTVVLVNKAAAVATAGGVGMLLVNVPGGATTTLAIPTSIPVVHLLVAYRGAVEAWAATAGATATLAGTLDYAAPAPYAASFTSKGPSQAGGGNLLKPDVMAPGVSVLAVVAPPGNNGAQYALYDGTSMATPHIAGIAALFKELHPTWSPAAIKSALMTSAGDILDGPNTDPAVIFTAGAGFVNPQAAADPGVVFDANYADWLGFLCGTELPVRFCSDAQVPVIDPSNVNVASIALGAMAGTQTVTRRITNVSKVTSNYLPSVSGLAGFTVEVSPARITLAAGQTKTIAIRITRTTAPLDTYGGGRLVLQDGLHKVALPVVVYPVVLAAPAEASGSYAVKFGYTGSFGTEALGLVPALKQPGSISLGATRTFTVTVPPGTAYARFSLFDTDVKQAGADLDMTVAGPGLASPLTSGGPTANEQVDIASPTPGVYTVTVTGYSVTGTVPFNLYSWSLPAAPVTPANMLVTAPASAVLGATGTVQIATTGLVSGTKYFGAINYTGGAAGNAPTLVRIDK